MIVCPYCSKLLEDGTKFCSSCGKQLATTIFCQKCGTQTSTAYTFCHNCGAPLMADAPAPFKAKKEKPKKPRSKFPTKLVIIGSACITFVVIAAIVLSSFFSTPETINYALYLKDDEVYYTDISKIEPWQVTSRLIDDENIDSDDVSDYAYSVGLYTHLTSDGKMLFFVDKIVEESHGFSLFYRYVNKPEQEPTKIDSDVVSYTVSEDGKLVTYLKGEDGDLYQHDLTSKEKIATDVSAFEVSDDGNKIGYLNDDGDLYLKYANKEKEKLDSNVDRICHINEAFDTVYYIKEGNLYKLVENSEKEKIDSDVYSVINVYDTGEIYYLKSDDKEFSLLDYIEDDMKSKDQNISEPIAPEAPDYWDYYDDYYYDIDYDAYYEARDKYLKAYEKYEENLDLWYEKQARDDLREELADEKIGNLTYTLCYFDGTSENVLTNDFASGEFDMYYVTASETPVMTFTIYNPKSLKKVKLSSIEDASDAGDMIITAFSDSSENHIAIKDDLSIIEQTDARNFDITSDGKTVYFFDNVSEETYHGDIFKIDISGDSASKPELYDSDAYALNSRILADNRFVYYKDVKDSKGELFIDKQQVDYDVYIYSLYYLDEFDAAYYMIDWNKEKEYGTLKMFKDNTATKIADDVHSFEPTLNGEILYLYDYNTTYDNGELFIYKDGKPQKIDDDVSAIIPISNSKHHGNTYSFW